MHSINPDATPEQIKDIVLRNHSNLKTPLQRLHAYNTIQQKPDEALQTYNSRYKSYFTLAYPSITIEDAGSKMQCIHYASSLLGRLGDEMEEIFNQDLPESLQAVFKKAINFKPCILTKQNINTGWMNEVNHQEVDKYDDEYEINKTHVRNPNYKGKNYDPNYQNRNKSSNFPSNNTNSTGSGYNKAYNSNGNTRATTSKGILQDKPTNMQGMLTGPVNKDQLFKIQEVLRHPSQYREKLSPNDASNF